MTFPIKQEVTFRAVKDGPWCWQSKEARRRIRERMNGDSKTVYVLSVYDALTEIASDESSEAFKTSHPYLATKAGCGLSQLKLALKELTDAGLVVIETPKLRGPCTFTLIALAGNEAVSRTVTNASHDTASDSRNTANVSHKPNFSAMAIVEEKGIKAEEPENKNDNDAAGAALSFLRKGDFQGIPKNLRDVQFLETFGEWIASENIDVVRRAQLLRICSSWRDRGDTLAELRQRVTNSADSGWDYLFDEKHSVASHELDGFSG